MWRSDNLNIHTFGNCRKKTKSTKIAAARQRRRRVVVQLHFWVFGYKLGNQFASQARPGLERCQCRKEREINDKQHAAAGRAWQRETFGIFQAKESGHI